MNDNICDGLCDLASKSEQVTEANRCCGNAV